MMLALIYVREKDVRMYAPYWRNCQRDLPRNPLFSRVMDRLRGEESHEAKTKGRSNAKSILRRPDLLWAKATALNSLTTPDAPRGYRDGRESHALTCRALLTRQKCDQLFT